MKKLIVMGIVAVMVMGLAVAGNAYVFQGIADKDGSGAAAMNSLTWGTNAAASSKAMPANTGTAAELAIAGNQAWDPAVAGAPLWQFQAFVTAAPAKNIFNFGLWAGANYAGVAGHENEVKVAIWATNVTGLDLSKTYEFKNVKTGEVYWAGTFDATKKTKAAPIFSAFVAVPKTASPDTEAMLCSFGEQVPEPGSMVAMLSGLVGLVGFGIRRRK